MTIHSQSLQTQITGRYRSLPDELAVALQMVATTTQTIHHADNKSGMLGAVLGLTIAGASSQLETVEATVSSSTATGHVSMVLLLLFATSLLAAGVVLGLTHFPRLTVPEDVCWLAFPALARTVGGRLPGTAELCEEAWREARVLSRIALRKQNYLRACVICTGLCVTTFLGWLVHASIGGL